MSRVNVSPAHGPGSRVPRPYLIVLGLSDGVSPDGNRFLVIRWTGGGTRTRLHVVGDWRVLMRSAEEGRGLR